MSTQVEVQLTPRVKKELLIIIVKIKYIDYNAKLS